jgi:hypothetical protein
MIIDKEEKEKVLEKLSKLMAAQGDGAVNENEINAASKIMQKLMDKYGIKLEEIQSSDSKINFVDEQGAKLRTARPKGWVKGLSGTVAQFYNCRVIHNKGNFTFIGFEMDTNMAKSTFERLFWNLSNASYQATKIENGTRRQNRINDFCCGALRSINRRFKQIKDEMERLQNQTALVIVKNDIVNSYVDDKYKNLRTSSTSSNARMSTDYFNGVQHGERAELHKVVNQ